MFFFLPTKNRNFSPLTKQNHTLTHRYSTSLKHAWWRWKGLSSFEHQIAVSTMQLLRGHETAIVDLFERYGTGDGVVMCMRDACRFANDFNVSQYVERRSLMSSEMTMREMTGGLRGLSSSLSKENTKNDDEEVGLIQSQLHQIFFASWRSYMTDRFGQGDNVKLTLNIDSFIEFCGRVAIALYTMRRIGGETDFSGHAPDIAIDIVQSFLARLNVSGIHLKDEMFDLSLLE